MGKKKGVRAVRLILPQAVLQALSLLEEAGCAAYTVGGCVRDQVLGILPHDYDICTSARPEEMRKVFASFRTVDTGIRHGTLTVLIDDMPLEITTFRVDGEYRDGRHPSSVRFTRRVEEDLSRRDFTINAMAYSPQTGLIDPFGGRRDCERGVIRCVGDAETRFEEDALRILRALRFSARLSFPIEENTAAAIHAGKEKLNRISRERVAAELNGLLLGDQAGKILEEYADVLETALGEKTANADLPSTLRALDAAPRDPAIRWAILLRETGDRSGQILRGLKMPGALIENVSALVTWADRELRQDNLQWALVFLAPGLLGKCIDMQRALHPDSVDAAALHGQLNRLLEENACYTLKQLAVRGPDLAALGYQGKEIGDALQALLLAVAKNELPNQKEALLHAARKERKK